MRTHINHRDDNTTSLCEGSHSAIKALLRAQGSEVQRVDKLIYFLLRVVAETYSYRDVRKHHSALLQLLMFCKHYNLSHAASCQTVPSRSQLIARSAIAYPVHWSAGLAKNQQAETLITEALKKAREFDVQRLRVGVADAENAGDAANLPTLATLADDIGMAADSAADELTVSVLSEDKSCVAHTLTNPHTTFAACSCPAATQKKMCHMKGGLLAELQLESQARRATDLPHAWHPIRFAGRLR